MVRSHSRIWGYSSAGRALALQARCRRFDPVYLHHMMKCVHCNTETTNDKYCSNACQRAAQTAQKKKDFLEGKYVGRHMGFRCWSKELLEELFGAKCNCCGLGPEYNGKPLTLQVNHKDGDAKNNAVENVELLCPNCHSQTENYGRKNKVSSRDWRRKVSTVAQSGRAAA